MKYRWAALIFLGAFIIQAFILGSFRILDCNAGLILCAGAALAFACPEDTSAVVIGGLAALLYDICFSLCPGMGLMAYLLTVTLCIVLKERLLSNENRFSMPIVSLLSVAVYYHIYWLCARIAGLDTAYLSMLCRLPVYLLLDMPVMLVIYFILRNRNIRNRQDRYRRWESV